MGVLLPFLWRFFPKIGPMFTTALVDGIEYNTSSLLRDLYINSLMDIRYGQVVIYHKSILFVTALKQVSL